MGLECQDYIFTKLNDKIKISLETGLNQMIREFSDTDMDQVLSIWLDASVQAHDFVDRYFWESKLDDMRDVYIPGSETFVYDDEGTIKGFLSLYENTLAAIFVSPGCQSGGIGRKLVGKAKELRKKLTLEVYKKNEKSVRFYEMCGFRKVSEKIDPHTGHKELVMEFQASHIANDTAEQSISES